MKAIVEAVLLFAGCFSIFPFAISPERQYAPIVRTPGWAVQSFASNSSSPPPSILSETISSAPAITARGVAWFHKRQGHGAADVSLRSRPPTLANRRGAGHSLGVIEQQIVQPLRLRTFLKATCTQPDRRTAQNDHSRLQQPCLSGMLPSVDHVASSRRSFSGVVAVTAAATYAGAVIVLMGTMTNWFRYGFSLEAMYVAVPAVAGLLIAAGAAVHAWRTSRVLFAVVAVLCIGGFSIATVLAHRQAFGTGVPNIVWNHVETSGIATLHAHNRPVRYELQLQNPFSSSHREYLLLQIGDRSYHIPVQIFDSAAGGYALPNAPNDWIILRPTPDPAIYIAETGSFLPPPRSFRIDLRTERAVAIPPAG